MSTFRQKIILPLLHIISCLIVYPSFTIIANSHMYRVSPSGHLECVKWLVANRASLSAEDQLGRTALALAEEYQHKDVAAFIQTCIEESRDPNSSLYAMRSSRRGCVYYPNVSITDDYFITNAIFTSFIFLFLQ